MTNVRRPDCLQTPESSLRHWIKWPLQGTPSLSQRVLARCSRVPNASDWLLDHPSDLPWTFPPPSRCLPSLPSSRPPPSRPLSDPLPSRVLAKFRSLNPTIHVPSTDSIRQPPYLQSRLQKSERRTLRASTQSFDPTAAAEPELLVSYQGNNSQFMPVTPHHLLIDHRTHLPTTYASTQPSKWPKSKAKGSADCYFLRTIVDTSSLAPIRQPPYPSTQLRKLARSKVVTVRGPESQLLRIKADTSTTDPLHRPPYPSTQLRKSATSKVAGHTWGVGRRRAASKKGRLLTPANHCRHIDHRADSPTTAISTNSNQELSDLDRASRTYPTYSDASHRVEDVELRLDAIRQPPHDPPQCGFCEIGRNRPLSSMSTLTRFATTPIGCEYETVRREGRGDAVRLELRALPPASSLSRAAHTTPKPPQTKTRAAQSSRKALAVSGPPSPLLSPMHSQPFAASSQQPRHQRVWLETAGGEFANPLLRLHFQSNTTPSRSLSQTRTRTTRSSRKAAGRGIAWIGGGGVSPESLAVAASSPSVSLLPIPHPQYAMAPSQTETRSTARSGKAVGVVCVGGNAAADFSPSTPASSSSSSSAPSSFLLTPHHEDALAAQQ
ncbi:hypothetical protein CVT26_014788 [Gymnopilus dilepis]|uniref:Uncharacterized protein n=1 Tax=Gymnopilus dilepis TaxID=231916 RepID=A0A409X3Y9_9AGAR|nr:hypothetical protein CVT26_014788 [Gymnopilus dilepis]